jgi:hypothetical protein
MNMSDRQPSLLLPIGGVLILAAAGYGAYYYYQQQQRSGLEGITGNAKLVPKVAIAGLAISSDPKAWQALDRFQSAEIKKLVQESSKDLLPPEVDFARDIQPWMGQVFIGFLPEVKTQARLRPTVLFTQAPVEPKAIDKPGGQFVAVIEVKNRSKAEEFLNTKINPKLSSPPQEGEYKGVKIFETGETAGAFIDRYLVLAGNRSSLEQSIDTFQGGESFPVPPLTTTLTQPLLQFYIPNLRGALEQLDRSNPDYDIPQTLLQRVQDQAQAMVVAFGVEDTGLRLQTIVQLGAKAPPFQPAPGKVLSQFPADTYFLFSGFNFKQTWQNLLEQAKTEPTQQEGIDQIRKGFKENLNLDLDKDIIAWMDGEIALGLIPSEEGILKQARSGLVAVIQTSDRKAAEAALDKIDDLSKELPFPVSVQDREIEGVKVQEWTSPITPGSLLSYGWHQPDSMFVAMGPLGKVMAKPQNNSLADSPDFKTIAGSLDKRNQGYIYLNIGKMWSLYSQQILANLPKEQAETSNAVVSAINGVAMTASQPSPNQSKLDIFVALKPAQ